MSKEEIIEMLTHYYEVDINNCVMTNAMWIKEVARALTDPDYLKNLIDDYKDYKETLDS